MARANYMPKDMIGQGYYGTQIPAAIQRNILENPGWHIHIRKKFHRSP